MENTVKTTQLITILMLLEEFRTLMAKQEVMTYIMDGDIVCMKGGKSARLEIDFDGAHSYVNHPIAGLKYV